MLNLKAAYLYIAEAFGTKPEDRTDEQRDMTINGLRGAAWELRCLRKITHRTYHSLVDSIISKFSFHDIDDITRAKFCRDQARKL